MKLARRAHRVQITGFRLAGVRTGMKLRGRDVALVVADPPAVAAGVFTTNRTVAASVVLSRARIRGGRAAAVLVHAGNANAATGAQGLKTAQLATALAARLLGVPERLVLPCATGKIGVQVPRSRLLRGVRAVVKALDVDGFPAAAEAITTTDAFPKTAVRKLSLNGRRVTIAVLGKGGGMIAPNMATLLVFALTDARIEAPGARRALQAAVGPTLNSISVDGDMSTNDTVLLLASGAAGNAPLRHGSAGWRRFTAALTNALEEIGRLVVLDGEGAAHLVEIVVRGARSDHDARRVARAVGESTLCKAAFHGSDPNWGRFVCAAGTAGVPIRPGLIDVVIGNVVVCRRGRPVAGARSRAAARMRRREVQIALNLHLGKGTARLLASDLSPAYVRFNAEYTT